MSKESPLLKAMRRIPGVVEVPFEEAFPTDKAKAEYREALLKEIDILVMPDRRGRTRRDAVSRVRDLVMTRKWQRR